MPEGAYQSGQRNKAQFKRDLDQGMQRASTEVDRAKERAQDSGNAGGATATSR
jgi:hypothetical protein